MVIHGIAAAELVRTRDSPGAETELEVNGNLVEEVIVGPDGMAVSRRRRSEVAACALIHGQRVQSCR